MTLHFSSLLLGGLFVFSAATAGTLAGKVEMGPEKTQRRLVHRYSESDMTQLGPPAPQIAIVYLEGDLPPNPLHAEENPKAIEQIGLQFIPRVLPISVGDTVYFPNLDNTYHNVFSYSPENRFDLGRYRKGEGPPSETFDTPGEVSVFCEVHDHMRATILVLETTWYTSTDKEGNFELSDVPPGEYMLHVWISPRNNWSSRFTVTEENQTALILKP